VCEGGLGGGGKGGFDVVGGLTGNDGRRVACKKFFFLKRLKKWGCRAPAPQPGFALGLAFPPLIAEQPQKRQKSHGANLRWTDEWRPIEIRAGKGAWILFRVEPLSYPTFPNKGIQKFVGVRWFFRVFPGFFATITPRGSAERQPFPVGRHGIVTLDDSARKKFSDCRQAQGRQSRARICRSFKPGERKHWGREQAGTEGSFTHLQIQIYS